MSHDKHFETDEQCRIVELMKRLPHFITQSIHQYDELTKVMNPLTFRFFSGENCIRSPCFLLTTSGETTS